MFESSIYAGRRKLLKEQVKSGLILLPGNGESPVNYAASTYHFRQDSSFLYFFGLDKPCLIAIIDADSGEETLFGNDVDLDHIIWMGPRESVKGMANRTGIKTVLPLNKLAGFINQALGAKRRIHYLPPYRPEIRLLLSGLLEISPIALGENASETLIKPSSPSGK